MFRATSADLDLLFEQILDGRAIQLEVLSGWAAAAGELGDLPQGAIDSWLARRRALIAAGRSSMRVGHVDIFATATR